MTDYFPTTNIQSTLPVNDFSSWHLAKSQTFTVVSSEQEQNFRSVLQKLLQIPDPTLETLLTTPTLKSEKYLPQIPHWFFVSRIVGLDIIHIILPIPSKSPIKSTNINNQINQIYSFHYKRWFCRIVRKPVRKINYFQKKVIRESNYFIEPPSSPVTIQFSLWLHTIDLTACSWACTNYKSELSFA